MNIRLPGLPCAGVLWCLPWALHAQDDGAVPSSFPWLELLAPLLLLAALAAALAWLLRGRSSLLRRDGPLRLVQVLPVGPRERVLLIKIESQDDYLLLGSTPAQITLLGRVALRTGASPASGGADGQSA